MSTLTPNIHLNKPDDGEIHWAPLLNQNADIIDALMPSGGITGAFVDTGSTQTITGTKTFAKLLVPTGPVTFGSASGFTGYFPAGSLDGNPLFVGSINPPNNSLTGTTHAALFVISEQAAAVASSSAAVYGIYGVANGGVNTVASLLSGGEFEAYWDSAHDKTLPQLIGVGGYVESSISATHASGVTSSIAVSACLGLDSDGTFPTAHNAYLFRAGNGAYGVFTNVYGLYVDGGANNASGHNVAAGLYVEDLHLNGRTASYGVYLANQGTGPSAWALYSAGGQSYHAGNFGIGMTPVNALDVSGVIGSNGAAAGLAFTDRGGAASWMWYVSGDSARLWRQTIGDLLIIGNTGIVTFVAKAIVPDGTLSAPTYSFINETGLGMYRLGAGVIGFASAGTAVAAIDSGGNYTLKSTGLLQWASGAIGTASDMSLSRSGVGILSLSSGATPQSFRIFGTTTGTNYLEAKHDGSSSLLNHNGSGVLEIQINGANALFISAGGLFANTDNALDIGASGANRLRTGYFGTSLISPTINATTGFQVNGTPLASTNLSDSASIVMLAGLQTISAVKTFSAAPKFEKDGIATTATNGAELLNATASTSGVAVQYSPALHFGAHAWNTTVTAADNWIDWQIYCVPTSGATPTSKLTWQSSRSATSTPSYTERMSLTDAGLLTVTSLVFASDNANDLGASGATRPRTGYFGTSVDVGGSKFVVGSAGKVTTYNGTATAGNGMDAIVAADDRTVQSATISAVTLYAVPATGAGLYTLNGFVKVTRAATTSSSATVTVAYTDPDGVTVTLTMAGFNSAGTAATTPANSTTSTGVLNFSATLNCKASTNVTYTITYVSSGATTMQFSSGMRLAAI